MSQKCRFCCKSRLPPMDRSAISLRTTGFDPAALTLSMQLLRYAIYTPQRVAPGDQRGEPSQVLSNGG